MEDSAINIGFASEGAVLSQIMSIMIARGHIADVPFSILWNKKVMLAVGVN